MKKTTPTPVAAAKHSQRGKWVYKPITSTIVVCKCGNKYVSTRKGQSTCIRCIQDA